eukprot:sb/3470861/
MCLPGILDRNEPWGSDDLKTWLNTNGGRGILGETWDKTYKKRMVTRQERRHAVGTADTKLALRFGHLCSPFAALTCGRMVNNNYGFEPAPDNPKKLTVRFTPDPIVQAVAKKSQAVSRPPSQAAHSSGEATKVLFKKKKVRHFKYNTKTNNTLNTHTKYDLILLVSIVQLFTQLICTQVPVRRSFRILSHILTPK